MSNIVIINRGSRTYTLQPITRDEEIELADGTKRKRQVIVKERILLPGASIETISDDEATLLLGYNDLKDAAKLVPQNAAKIASMQAEIDRLTAANEKLEKGPAKEQEAVTEPAAKPEAKPSKKKGK